MEQAQQQQQKSMPAISKHTRVHAVANNGQILQNVRLETVSETKRVDTAYKIGCLLQVRLQTYGLVVAIGRFAD
jgi:hypothetical protein